MKNRIIFILKYLVFWVVYFLLARVIFLSYHHQRTALLSASDLVGVFSHGIWLDISFAAYCTLLPTIVVAFSAWLSNRAVRSLLIGYTDLVVVFISFLVSTDLDLYRNWGFRLDATPLRYLNTPYELIASAGSSPLLLLNSILVGLILLSIGVFVYGLSPSILRWKPSNRWGTFPAFILVGASLIIPIRGGLQLAPINQSSVYFSSKLFANHAALNVAWNFFDSAVNRTYIKDNPYNYFSLGEAQEEVKQLYVNNPGQTDQLLKTDRPNALIILWESCTAKVIEPLGGRKGITPNFTKLTKEGVLFTNVYASGDRSDKGIVAVLSGYPAQPTTSIITVPQKSAKLPVLSQNFNKLGYETSFYYGGEPEFANIKSFLLTGGFKRIVSKDDFPSTEMNTKWGAHDHIVFDRVLKDLNASTKPFFTTFFTLSSHEPFEVPVPTVIPGKDIESMFLNAHHYTDQTLGNFIYQAKKQAWWDNTLVIVIADHGHPLPTPDDKISNFRIPMLWLGGALAKKGVTVSTIGSQIDLAATLLAQLKQPYSNYSWSKNILNSQTQPFAYFAFNDGFGMVRPNRQLVFDHVGKNIFQQQGPVQPQDVEKGKAFAELSVQDYLDK